MPTLSPEPMNTSGRKSGFTLIELLIVVAIIAILAAIAVPNFLEAQTRSKVSRVLADHRANRTAVEAYAVDWNKYPRGTWGGAPFNDKVGGAPAWGTLPEAITTPIAYVTQIYKDPFSKLRGVNDSDEYYAYTSIWTFQLFLELGVSPSPVPGMPGFVYVYGKGPITWRRIQQYLGDYYLWSVGPAGPNQHPSGSAYDYFIQYDPTNGTISWGRVFVSHKHSGPAYVPNEYIANTF